MVDKNKTFHIDGMDLGIKDAIAHRKAIIVLRDSALEQGEIIWAVGMSHGIALFTMMGEEIWGKDWYK